MDSSSPATPTGEPGHPEPLARLTRLLDPRVRAALAAHLRAPRIWIVGGVLIVLALVLAALPLFGALGFEFAFVMAIAASIASADLGSALTRHVRDRMGVASAGAPGPAAVRPLHLVASLTAAAGLVALLVTAAPLAIISLNGLRVRTCDWLFGFECYGAMTVLSALWAAGVGVLCGLAAGPRRILSNALPYLVLLALVMHSLWRFYAAPPVFNYNPLVGYFPGNLYDEEIQLGAPFLWSRLHQVAFLCALLALAAALIDGPSAELRLHRRRPVGARWAALLACVAALGLALALRAHAGSLGFSVSAADLALELNGQIETQHFTIYYPRGGAIERDIALIAEDHEFRLAQVARVLGVPPPPGRIASFYFDSPEQKARLIGARRVQMAKPWRMEIYLQEGPFPHRALRHEIAHAVAGTFGDPVFHVSAGGAFGLPLFFNAGLIEGIAVAADWPDHSNRTLTPHQSVKAMVQMGMAPPVERLLSTGFLAFSSARSYTSAGSFVRFLLDRHGAARLQQLYRSGGDFRKAYDRPLGDLVAEWQDMLSRLELAPTAHEKVRERFRRGGIFERPCPHAVADRFARVARLTERGELDAAIRVARTLCRDVPDEPRHQMMLADILFRNDERGESAAIYRAIAADAASTSTTVRADALLSMAELAAASDDRTALLATLDRAAELPIDDDQARQVAARRLAASHTGPAGPALRAYFWPPDPKAPHDPVVQLGRAALAVFAEPDLALGHYLVGRNLSERGAGGEAARALARALELGLEHPLLVRECAQLLAAEAYAAGDLEMVERAAAVLTGAQQPEVTRLLGFDWLERVHWKRTGRLTPSPLGPRTTPPAERS